MTKLFYTSQKFHDFDDFAATMQLWNWDVQINQLHRGSTETHLKQFNTENMLITSAVFNGSTQQTGDLPPAACTIALLSDTNSNLTFQKKQMPPNCLMLMPNNSELDAVTKVRAGVYSISLFEKFFQSLTKNDRLKKQFKENNLMPISIKAASELRYLFQKYFFFLDQNPRLSSDRAFAYEFNTTISKKLVHSLAKAGGIAETRRYINKKKVWNRIEAYLDESVGSAVRITKLSEAAQVSDSTLLRLFHERFEISPKTYINMIRLNGLHHELKHADISKTKIIEIMSNWDFWHMGQTAADYKKMFGELPSETLKSYNSPPNCIFY